MTLVFSKTVAYGVYLLLYLNRRETGDVSSLGAVASDLELLPEEVQKVTQALAEAGLIHMDSALGGKCRLGKSLSQIPFLAVLDALEAPPRPIRCLDNPQRLCVAYPGMWQMQEGIRAVLRGKTIASLLGPARAGYSGALTALRANRKNTACAPDQLGSCCECPPQSLATCVAATMSN